MIRLVLPYSVVFGSQNQQCEHTRRLSSFILIKNFFQIILQDPKYYDGCIQVLNELSRELMTCYEKAGRSKSIEIVYCCWWIYNSFLLFLNDFSIALINYLRIQ